MTASAQSFSVQVQFTAKDGVSQVVSGIATKTDSFANRLSTGLGKVQGATSAISSGLRQIGAAAAAAGAAGGLLGGHIVAAGADFEEAISGVGAVSLMTRDQIADLEAKALELGSTTKFTATEAAKAMEIMARAGFTNAQVLESIPGVLAAAAAEGAEMAEVANHVSNVLKGMGLQASEAGRVADVLALASARTNSSIGSLGESMKNLSPVAKQFGIGIEDAVAMVALLQDVGLDASEAGTATATMLTKLAKPIPEVAAQMKAMGIEFKDAAGNMLPPLEVFQQMQNAAGELGGNMDKVAFFSDLVGLRGQKAALNLKDLFASDKGKTLTEELRNAAGSAQKMADLRMQNLKGDFTILKSAVEGVEVAIFDLQSGPLRGIVQATTQWVSANQRLITAKVGVFMRDLIRDLPKIVDRLTSIGKAVLYFKGFELAVGAASSTMKVVSAVNLLTGAIKNSELAMMAFNTIAAVNPLVWIVGAVAAVALMAIYWDDASAALDGFLDRLSKLTGARALADWFFDDGSAASEAVKRGDLLEEEAPVRRGGSSLTDFGSQAFDDIMRRSEELTRKLEARMPPVADDQPAADDTAATRVQPVRTATDDFMMMMYGDRGADPFAMPKADIVTKQEVAQKTSAELVIRDETGKAQLTKQPAKRTGVAIKLQPSGTP